MDRPLLQAGKSGQTRHFSGLGKIGHDPDIPRWQRGKSYFTGSEGSIPFRFSVISLAIFQSAVLRDVKPRYRSIWPKGRKRRPWPLSGFRIFKARSVWKPTCWFKAWCNIILGKFRVVFKNRPLELHPEAVLAHEAAMAAAEQAKFWEMHDLILANQKAMKRGDFISYARRLGLDSEKFVAALDKRTYRPVVEKDVTEARRREVRGTPVFLVNGNRIDGIQLCLYLKKLLKTSSTERKWVTGDQLGIIAVAYLLWLKYFSWRRFDT